MNTTGPKTPPRAANPTSQPYALLPYQPPAAFSKPKALVPGDLVPPSPLAPCCSLVAGVLAQHLLAAVPFFFSSLKLPDLNCAGSTARRSKTKKSVPILWRCLSHQLLSSRGDWRRPPSGLLACACQAACE